MKKKTSRKKAKKKNKSRSNERTGLNIKKCYTNEGKKIEKKEVMRLSRRKRVCDNIARHLSVHLRTNLKSKKT